LSKAQTTSRVHAIPQLRFEQQQLTSFSGLVLFQLLFTALDLRARLAHCFHASRAAAYGTYALFMQLVVHVLLGFRSLRDRDHYADDPLVARVCGSRRVADVATLSRRLGACSDAEADAVDALGRELVLDRVAAEKLATVTLDFDGSVLSTRRHAEGTAVGYNKKKKGARSYYPLFCTVAQTSQFLSVLHRPGNVHDSNGACQFMAEQIVAVRLAVPGARMEARIDAAFFDEKLLFLHDREGVEFSASVPFERFPELKARVERTRRWHRIDEEWSYAECDWSPKSWTHRWRFVLLRRRSLVQRKEPLQLDLFAPREHEFEYKVIVTNKSSSAHAALLFHNGRGAQEAIFGEAKTAAALEYIPMRRRVGNRLFLAAAMMAHNLSRELQMRALPRTHTRSPLNRAALWTFEKLDTIRHRLIQRAGRLTRPQGTLTLTMSANAAAREDVGRYVEALGEAA
jgi:hypothetical protein